MPTSLNVERQQGRRPPRFPVVHLTAQSLINVDFPTFSIDTYYNLSQKIEVWCMVNYVGLIIVHCMINGVILNCVDLPQVKL